jgi:hypothetical protein
MRSDSGVWRHFSSPDLWAMLAVFLAGFALAPDRDLFRLAVGIGICIVAYALLWLDRDRGTTNAGQRRAVVILGGLVGLALAILGPSPRTNLVCLLSILVSGLLYSRLPALPARWPAKAIMVLALSSSFIPFAFGYASGHGRPVWWIAVIAVSFWILRWSQLVIALDGQGRRPFYALYSHSDTAWACFGGALVGYFGVLATLAFLAPDPWFTLGLVATAAIAGTDLGQRRWLLRSVEVRKMDVIARRGLVLFTGFSAAIAVCMLVLA